MRNSVVWLLLMVSLSAHAQVDSLERKLPTLTGIDKAVAYQTIIAFYIRSDIKKAEAVMIEARNFARTEKNPVARAYILIGQGLYASNAALTDSAIYYLEQARVIGEKANDYTVIIKANGGLGKTYIGAGRPEKGLESLYAALRLLDIHPDNQTEMKVRINIMWAYLELKRHKDCIQFGRESIALSDPKSEWITLFMYNNIAVSYGAIGQLDSARYFIDKGMRAARSFGDYQSLANAHFILGKIYAESGKPALAVKEYLAARPYREKVGDPLFLVSDLYSISTLYHQAGDYRKGVDAGLEALAIAEQYQMTLKFENVYASLAKNYEGMRDYRNASKYYNLFAQAKDSVYKNATVTAIAEMQTKYETGKKQQQLVVQRAQLAEQSAEIRNVYLMIAALTIITILITIILVLARNRYRRRHELQRKENEIIIRETYMKATIQSQETERKRFAQDLHDSIGQLISSLRMLLSTLDGKTSITEKSALVEKSEVILDEMHKEIRSVAFNLMPQTLIQQGLLPAFQEMAIRINQTGRVWVSVQGFEMPTRLPEVQEISLYRIVQEWVNNVLKYAGAKHIDIQLVGHTDEINVTIEDDGEGFDKTKLTHGEGNGWKNIQSRLNLIKGEIEIDSIAGRKGTMVVLVVKDVVPGLVEERELTYEPAQAKNQYPIKTLRTN